MTWNDLLERRSRLQAKQQHERSLKSGKPSRSLRPTTNDELKHRFFSKIRVVDSGCHEWIGPRQRGYGVFDLGLNVRAHRVSYLIQVGPIDNDLCVLHKCDNRCCVNPEHLFLGTQKDNIIDCAYKYRLPKQVLRREDYEMIANEYASLFRHGFKTAKRGKVTELADKYGVTPRTIIRIGSPKLFTWH